jgi:putative endonuclease
LLSWVIMVRRDPPQPTTTLIGREAEARACAFLQQQGLILIERNFRCRVGEIDLIMRDAQTLVFVEVRCRKDRRFGGAAASVGRVKQQRLLRSASAYLSRLARPPACRFDLIAIEGDALHWIRHLQLSAG